MSVSHVFPVRPLHVPANVQLLLTPLEGGLALDRAAVSLYVCLVLNEISQNSVTEFYETVRGS